MAQATTVKPVSNKTCSQCIHFNDYNESNGRGWCNLFEQQARTFHVQTNNCILNNSEAFPTEVIELDREGYPMGNINVQNAYFDNDFITHPDEPF